MLFTGKSKPTRPSICAIVLGLGACLIGQSNEALAKAEARLLYGQSPKFVRFFRDLKDKEVSDSRIRQTMESIKGNYETGFAHLTLSADLPLELGENQVWPDRFAYSVNFEGAAGLEYRDPVTVQMRMAQLYGGYFTFGYTGPIANELYFYFGLAAGAGSELRDTYIDQSASLPVTRASAKGLALMAGVDVKLQKVWRLSDSLRLISSAQTEESFFRSIRNKYEGSMNWDLRSVSHDWLVRQDFRWSLFSAHALAGKHPYPTRILNRFMNRVRPISSDRSLETTLGFGGGATTALGPYFQIAGLGGYYAGAIGGEFRLRVVNRFDIHVNSYALEYSNEYQTFTQRTYQAVLQFDL